jgi:thermolysin
MSVTQQSGTFRARDEGRPAIIITADAEGNYTGWFRNQINAAQAAARDSDNLWEDGAVVDAHTYAGWTYDYFFRRFGRRGLNGSNGTIVSYVHYARRGSGRAELNNTFWNPTNRSVNYGDGDGNTFNYFSSALDVVVHELTHGVIMATANFVYRNESGALGEAFSDIMGISAEFFFEPRGSGRQQSEWLFGEDLYIRNFGGGGTAALRSAANPQAFGNPDHYSRRFRGQQDNGGVHINSTIPTHAFYLFVQGGTNRTSGRRVQGIGLDNIERAEQIFYRALTRYLGPTSDFSDARKATLQSARDLYGGGSRDVQQLTAAWDAVGIR